MKSLTLIFLFEILIQGVHLVAHPASTQTHLPPTPLYGKAPGAAGRSILSETRCSTTYYRAFHLVRGPSPGNPKLLTAHLVWGQARKSQAGGAVLPRVQAEADGASASIVRILRRSANMVSVG